MSIVVKGRIAGLVILVLTVVLFYVFMNLVKRGRKYQIRSIPAMAAIPEAVGRASEMGTGIYYAVGARTISDPEHGPMELAGISMLGYVSRLSAKAGVKPIFFTPAADMIPLAEDTMRNAYLAEGKPEEYDASTMISFAPGSYAWMTSSIGWMQRERPAACLYMGSFDAMAVVLAEAGNTIGAMQVAGCANIWQIPFFVATCDYVMISEELYAANAVISEDMESIGLIRGEDLLKAIILAALGLGLVLGYGKIDLIINILRS